MPIKNKVMRPVCIIHFVCLLVYSTLSLAQTKSTIIYGTSESYRGSVSLYHNDGKLISSTSIKNKNFVIRYKLYEPTLCKLKFSDGISDKSLFLDNVEDVYVTLANNDSLIVKKSEIHKKWLSHNDKVDSIRRLLIITYSLKQRALKDGDSTKVNSLINTNNKLSQYAGLLINRSPFVTEPLSYFNLYLLTEKGLVGNKEEGDFLMNNKGIFSKYPTYKKLLTDWHKLDKANRSTFIDKRFNFYDSKIAYDQIHNNNYNLIIFWASWCGPCLIEIREINTMKSLIREKNVSITYISLDKNKKAWEKAVKKNTYDEINIIASPNLLKAYNIRSIPRNFLVNDKGIIVLENIDMLSLKEYLVSKKNKN